MPVHSSSYDHLIISLTPIQLVARLPRALRRSREKYETTAELLVKWFVSTSRKGRVVFSTQLPLENTVNASTESTQMMFSLTGMENIVFEAKMRRKSQNKCESDAVLYQKKMLRLEVTLLMRKRKNSSIHNTMKEVSFRKKDVDDSVSSISLTKCLIDLRDLLPVGNFSHRVRLQMEHKHDYMDVDCVVQSPQDPLTPEACFCTTVGCSSTPTGTSRSSSNFSTSTSSIVSTGGSESVATSISYDAECKIKGKETTEMHKSSVMSTEVVSLGHKSSSKHPLMLTTSDVQIPLREEDISNVKEVNSIHNTDHHHHQQQQQQQKQEEELAEEEESSMMLTMAPMPNADPSDIYEYCETSAHSVALFYQHGEGRTTFKPPFSPLQQILKEGMSWEQEFMEHDPMKLFNKLFPQHAGIFALMPALHTRRRDIDYPTTPTWLEVPTTYPHVAYYTTSYKMRYRKDQSLDADEYGVIVAAGDRVLAHVMNVAPTAPLVGSDLRLELVVEIMQGGRVRAVVFLCVPRKLRLLIRSQITSQRVKFETLVRETLYELANLNSHKVSKSIIAPAKETPSLLQLKLSSSVDPNMWRRLRSAEIFLHESHVEVILSRLYQIDLPPPRECEPLVRTLEELVCRHRESAVSVRLVTLILMRIIKERINMEELIKASPTLASTLQQVYVIQPVRNLFTAEVTIPQFNDNQTYTNSNNENKTNLSRVIDVEEFLKTLDVSAAFQQARKRREISAIRNVWEVLSVNVGDRVITAEVVQRIRSERILLSSEKQCHLLNAALVLHMDYAPIAIAILVIMLHNYRYNDSPFFHDLQPLAADFIFAIKRAMKIYHEHFVYETSNSLLSVRDAFREALEKRDSNLTYFEKHFLPVLSEDSLFTCKIRCIHTTIGLGEADANTDEMILTVTASFICIGSNAFPLMHIQRVRLYKHWWCLPALSFYIKTPSNFTAVSVHDWREVETQHAMSIVVWKRKELLSVLLEINSEILVEY
ncbi:hypothetical protein LSM04_009687 [Trypanosoma melophagium]|uniref:uncharacterized protein n=1 Tax=Trypanosoma melophagium TaxID=715481 RepID=UPI00351A1238|nr:hypothetical protein LSM04_009687 [Trypanosoma melophagium]